MARQSRSDILVAKRSFVVGQRVVRKGETFRRGHPITEGREQLFGPFEVDNEFAVTEKRESPKREPRKQEPERKPDPIEPNPEGSI